MTDFAKRMGLDETRGAAIQELIATYQESDSVAEAAEKLGVCARSVYRWRDLYPELRKELERTGLAHGGREGRQRSRNLAAVLQAFKGSKTLAEAAERAGVDLATVTASWPRRYPEVIPIIEAISAGRVRDAANATRAALG